MLAEIQLKLGPGHFYHMTICVNTLCEMDSLTMTCKHQKKSYNITLSWKGDFLVQNETKQPSVRITDKDGRFLQRTARKNEPVQVRWINMGQNL